MNYTKSLLLTLLILIFSSYSFAGNIGHRVAAGPRRSNKNLPENSIMALKAALIGFGPYRALQNRKDFVYLEFDLQETADGEIVLFHDKDLKRMLPNNSINREALKEILTDPETIRRMGKQKVSYKNLKIKHLTLNQLQSLILYPTRYELVPTLEDFLKKSLEWNIQKPMTFEIKYFHSDQARNKLIRMVKNYKNIFLTQQDIIFERKFKLDKSGISFLAFKGNLEDSFPRDKWCPIFKMNGFKAVYLPILHINICK